MDRGDDGVRAWAALLTAHGAAVEAISDDVLAATGLPLAWYDVLLELNAAPGRRLRMRDLGDVVVLSRTRVSRIVDEMERSGLVRRTPDPSDGRVSFAELTTEGRRRLVKAAPAYLRSIDDRFSRHLTRSEARSVRTALEKVRRANEPDPGGRLAVRTLHGEA